MILVDTCSGERFTMRTLRHEYDLYKYEDPWNHARNFKTELYEILMASVNGRNDFDIVGPTPAEVFRYILRLRSNLNKA